MLDYYHPHISIGWSMCWTRRRSGFQPGSSTPWPPGLWVAYLDAGALPDAVLGWCCELAQPPYELGDPEEPEPIPDPAAPIKEIFARCHGSAGGMAHATLPFFSAQLEVALVLPSGALAAPVIRADSPATLAQANGSREFGVTGSWPPGTLLQLRVRAPGGAGAVPGAFAFEGFRTEL